MSDRSQVRFEQLLSEELSKIMLREVDLESGALVTITKADVSADLRHATVFVTILPEERRGTILEQLRKKHREFEYHLSDILKRGRSPQLTFEIDSGAIQGFAMHSLLDELSEDHTDHETE